MILESGSDGTEHTDMFGRGRWPGALHRVLKTPFFETWKNKLAADDTEFGQPTLGRTTMFENVCRFSTSQLLELYLKTANPTHYQLSLPGVHNRFCWYNHLTSRHCEFIAGGRGRT